MLPHSLSLSHRLTASLAAQDFRRPASRRRDNRRRSHAGGRGAGGRRGRRQEDVVPGGAGGGRGRGGRRHRRTRRSVAPLLAGDGLLDTRGYPPGAGRIFLPMGRLVGGQRLEPQICWRARKRFSRNLPGPLPSLAMAMWFPASRRQDRAMEVRGIKEGITTS